MTKPELRKIYLQKRLALTDQECEALSQQICDKFFSSIDLTHIKVIHTFLPIIKKNEPDTRLIIERLKKDFPHIKISIPKVVGNTLVNYFLDADCVLTENVWGVREPSNGNLTEPEEIDLVIVPLLAFDATGHRVGYGKGFYDRFLKTCRQDCMKVGISFFDCSAIEIDIDEHDFLLTKSITPATCFTF